MQYLSALSIWIILLCIISCKEEPGHSLVILQKEKVIEDILSFIEKSPDGYKAKTSTHETRNYDNLFNDTGEESPIQLSYYDTLFKDEKYAFIRHCMGRLGGGITIHENGTASIRFFISFCPIAINKINDEYYISVFLAHGTIKSDIKKIKDISELPFLSQKVFEESFSWWQVVDKKYFELMVIEDVYTETLIDRVRLQILNSFKFKNQLYHITTDWENTYLQVIEDGKLVTIETLADESLVNYNDRISNNENGFILTIYNNDFKGMLELTNDTLSITKFKLAKNDFTCLTDS